MKEVIQIKTILGQLKRSYLGRNWSVLWKFALIGGLTMAAQIKLQGIELDHGHNIYVLSPVQGFVLSYLGMAANKIWTFRERDLSWTWAVLLWSIQRWPHTVASNAIWASLMQVPSLPYWEATVLTTVALGGFSFIFTNEGVKGSLFFDRLLFVLAFYLVATKMQLRPARPLVVKTETA